MIFNVRILPTANKELTDIVSYLNQHSKTAAKNFLDNYENQINLLRQGIVSYSLSRMPELAELGYHSAFVDDYLFLYYEEDDCIVIAHFFHQRQNYASLVCSREIE